MFLSAVAALAVAPQLSGPALLDDLSKKAFQFFCNESHTVTGLTKDRAGNFGPATQNPPVASVAATGYALAAFGIGAERGWAPRKEMIAKSRVALNFLHNKALKTRGWFVHFIDWADGSRVWNSEVSSIDTGILLSGMIINMQALHDPANTKIENDIINAIDWKWMLTDGGAKPDELTFSMGWTPEHGFINARWDSYSEELMFYVTALGAWPQMPNETWAAIKRPPLTYAGRDELVGGPLFMHEMSQGFLPMKGKRDQLGFDYGVEERNAALNNRQFCIDNPNHHVGYGQGIWGLTACDTPTGYKGLGGPGWGEDDGTVAPTCAIASVEVAPEIAIEAADTFYSTYPKAYGRYGFSNSINPGANWIDPDVIGIDLGMMMLSIEQWRDGLPGRLSLSNPIVKRGMDRAGFHVTHEGPWETRPLKR